MNEQIYALYKRNKDLFAGKPVAFDGVVDEKRYLQSKYKVSFLLKDINGEKTVIEHGIKSKMMLEHDWKYMEELRADILNTQKPLYRTWSNVCLWMEVLNNPQVSYVDCLNNKGDFDSVRLRNHMLDISIVNIKKTPGGGRSNYDEIKEAVNRNKELLKKEFEILNPRLIICGGTFEFAKIIYDVTSEMVHVLATGTEYFVIKGKVFLQFVHPMWYTVSRNILFNYAKNVFDEIRKEL